MPTYLQSANEELKSPLYRIDETLCFPGETARGRRRSTQRSFGGAEPLALVKVSNPPPSNRWVKLGVCVCPQYTDWISLREAGAAVDALGFDSLWTWDHLYPVHASPDGPIFEGYLTLAGWTCVTKRVTIGLMVGANTFRNPVLTTKMVTTLDHMSGGRAVLGIGGAWFELEHEAFGFDFGSSIGERLDRLDEAVMIMRGMLDGAAPSGRSIYTVRGVLNNPPPVQQHLKILIGGGGEKKTLATVARYADLWNVWGDVDTVRRKDQVLREWCEHVGRHTNEIEQVLWGGPIVVRASEAEARRVMARIQEGNLGLKNEPELAGTPEVVVERLFPYLRLGFRHIYVDSYAPFDRETFELLTVEVRPRLEDRLAR
jgi:alkanesulfonate monooxygenase SsuD/methylene tetrahydromethanopterin reductase-like flavin-dependent oxidoreductase (luciferase family)